MNRGTPRVLVTILVLAGGMPGIAREVGQSKGFKAIYNFGDSLSDTGNLPSVMPFSPPYDPRRAANGKLFVDFLAEFYGIAPVTPSTSGGTNYAWGGATASPDLTFIPGSSGIEQVQQYLGRTAGVTDKKGLYIIGIGLNDIGARIGSGTDPVVAGAETAADVEIMLGMLLSAGAEHVWLIQEPVRTDPLEQFFEPIIPGFYATFEAGLEALNAHLASAVAAIDPRKDIHVANIGAVEDQFRANPGAYGFKDVTHACVAEWPLPWWSPSPLTVCSEPNTFLYWDHTHRTEQAHRFYAERLATSLR